MDRFLRSEMLLGGRAMEALRRSHVAVFGIGGVGSWAAEALARSGIGTITLVDSDVVDITNINRQAIALTSTVGMSKTEVMHARILDINPNAKVNTIVGMYHPDDRERFFLPGYDYIIDAIDTVTGKLDLIATAKARGIPIISSMGTGNKLDPTRFEIADISKTHGCPLARVIRKELKRRGIESHTVLYSSEEQIKPEALAPLPPGKRQIPGSVSWVPPVAGFILAGEVVKHLCGRGLSD